MSFVTWWWRKRRHRTVTYSPRVIALAPIAYYQLGEASGTTATDSSGNARDGTYTNALPGGTGIGDGQTGATFDGTGDVVNIAAMRAAFNGNTGSFVLWGKTSAWTDATLRYLIRIGVGTTNQVFIQKTVNSNELAFAHTGGGTNKTITSTALAGTNAYFCAGMTWGGGSLKAYVNGAQVGTTQTGLGTFAGTVSSAICAVGANGSGGINSWNGSLAHAAIFDTALSDADMLSLGVL